MYRGPPSPIFDVPEFPALRRIRPLPKRRRTETHGAHNQPLAPGMPPLLPPAAAAAFLQQQQHSLDLLGPNATTEDLLSHADTITALQSYYMPILGGVQNFLAGASANPNADPNGLDGHGNTTAAAAAAAALAAVANAGRNGPLSLPLGDIDSMDFGVTLAAAAAAAAAAAGVAIGGMGGGGGYGSGMVENIAQTMGMAGNGGNPGVMGGENLVGLGGHDRDDDDPRNADHYDQSRLHGHGNTKKRKVPANAHGSHRGISDGRPGSPVSAYHGGEGNEAAGGHDGEGFDGQDEDAVRERDRDRDRERDRERDRDRDRERDRDRDDSSPSSVYPPPPFPGQLSTLTRKRGKLTAVTLAGLQHKEMLKTRKRQLAAVMGALSHGDTLALDQALSTNYPLLSGMGGALGMSGSRAVVGVGGESSGETSFPLPVRKSKRRTVRLARAMKLMLEMPERRNRHPDAVPFPVSEFSFSCPSGTAERLISTKEEVLALRKRFEAELARQAAKAAKAAVTTTGTGGKAVTKVAGGRGKKERQDRDKERAEKVQQRVAKSAAAAANASGATGAKNVEQPLEASDPVPSNAVSVVTTTSSGGGGSGGAAGGGVSVNAAIGTGIGGMKTKPKKKKRSALANASNPHHLRNYVPSRLPHSGDGASGGKGNANANSNSTWPLPLLFLSSEIPPRRRDRGKKASAPVAPSPLIQLTQPADEWICAFCEYDLFYGDDAAYRRAVRSRKKILRRRRRARERAAAAASGVAAGLSAAKAPPPPPPSEEYDDGYDEAGDAGVDDYGSAPPQRNPRWKAGPDKESAAFG